MCSLRASALVLLAASAIGCTPDPSLGKTFAALSMTVTTDQASYTPGQPIQVTYGTFAPPDDRDWIGLSEEGALDISWWKFQYTMSVASGTVTFNNFPPGRWVARSFPRDSFQKEGESLPFDIVGPTPTIVTDAAGYGLGAAVTVDFANFPGNQHDFIGLVRVGTGPNHGVEEWFYMNGATSGQLTFHPTAGTFELRGCFEDTWNRIATSSPFTVGASVTTDKGTYGLNEMVNVQWSGFPTDPTDYVAIALEGAPVSSYIAWQATGGSTSGTYAFPPLPAGRYRARGFASGTFNLIGESPTFVVSNGATVSSDRATYSQGDPITATWTGLPGGATDWIGVVQDADPTQLVSYIYTGGAAAGSGKFTGIPPGVYRLRAYPNDTYVMLAESAAFTVTGPMIQTDAAAYTVGDPVVVTFAGLPGNAADWIGISPAGSPATSYVQYQYTGGAAAGMRTFLGLPAGSYVARAYVNDTYTILAETVPFDVN